MYFVSRCSIVCSISSSIRVRLTPVAVATKNESQTYGKVPFWYIRNHSPCLHQTGTIWQWLQRTFNIVTCRVDGLILRNFESHPRILRSHEYICKVNDENENEKKFSYHGWHHTLAECFFAFIPDGKLLVSLMNGEANKKHFLLPFFLLPFWRWNRWKMKKYGWWCEDGKAPNVWF